MANSKTPAKKSKTKSTKKATTKQPTRLAVAFSGGLDSAVLLHATIQAHGPEHVYAFHVHHGIQKEADQWQKHCQQLAKKWGCHFDTINVQLEHASNIESQARDLRYQALYEMCHKYKIEDLLVAHHLDDQAETVLIQLMRGAGLAGLSGMPANKSSASTKKTKKNTSSHIHVWRPFLEMRREDLEAYAKKHRLKWIEDPSNQDEGYRRNAVRKTLLPQLEKTQQGAIVNLARSAKHIAEAQELLHQLADIDLGLIVTKEGLSKTNLVRLYKTNQARASNALRRWLQQHQLSYPSTERLASWWQDLLEVRTDAQLQWQHDDCLIRLWRGVLTITPQEPIQEKKNKETEAEVKTEAETKTKTKTKTNTEQAGEWVFKRLPSNSQKPGIAKERFDEAKKKGLINTMARDGGEKFKVHPQRPRKTLKNLYQEAGIPPWQRDLPLLYIGTELVAVAGIGISADWLTHQGPRISPEWQ
jgi:tRNA(Ile)-lysidine synthase